MSKFAQFMQDNAAWDMFITGPAGTGKTTSLKELVQECIDNEIPYIVCAYTHKACGILASKLPPEANIATLDSFLGKRPGINTNAKALKQVDITIRRGATVKPKVLFIDERSMIGEKDYLDIQSLQDPDYDGEPELKVVWIGDSNQLPPVGDVMAVKPSGEYQVELTKIWRNDNPLQEPLNALISYINDEAEPKALEPNSHFIRGKDLVKEFKASKCEDKVILAYTNKRVQELNEQVAGKFYPDPGDVMFSPTTQKHYKLIGPLDNVDYIDRHYTDPLHLGSKYRTLEFLVDSGNCEFVQVEHVETGDVLQVAMVFGHYSYKLALEALKREAVASNKAIEDTFKGYKAAGWAKANPKHKLARARAKAWRDFLSFDECVVCLDFPYAMTVHKSQGSTYQEVCLDTDNLAVAANTNFELYLKLAYVGISRASHLVITS